MFDLYEAAEEMMRQNLLRWFPEASEGEIRHRLRAWLEKREFVESPAPPPARA